MREIEIMYLSTKVVVVYSSGETRLKTKYVKCVGL